MENEKDYLFEISKQLVGIARMLQSIGVQLGVESKQLRNNFNNVLHSNDSEWLPDFPNEC